MAQRTKGGAKKSIFCDGFTLNVQFPPKRVGRPEPRRSENKKLKTEKRELILEFCNDIRQLYAASTFDEQIILYDIEAGELISHSYADFKSTLISSKSRKVLKKESQKAQKHDRILVVVSDSKYQTIHTHTVNRDPKQKFHMSKQTRIF